MTDYPKHECPDLTEFRSDCIALLSVSKSGEHQLNLFDRVKLPAGEYILSIDPRDTHGLNAAELQADAGRSTRKEHHAQHCMAQFNCDCYPNPYPCTCSAYPE